MWSSWPPAHRRSEPNGRTSTRSRPRTGTACGRRVAWHRALSASDRPSTATTWSWAPETACTSSGSARAGVSPCRGRSTGRGRGSCGHRGRRGTNIRRPRTRPRCVRRNWPEHDGAGGRARGRPRVGLDASERRAGVAGLPRSGPLDLAGRLRPGRRPGHPDRDARREFAGRRPRYRHPACRDGRARRLRDMADLYGRPANEGPAAHLAALHVGVGQPRRRSRTGRGDDAAGGGRLVGGNQRHDGRPWPGRGYGARTAGPDCPCQAGRRPGAGDPDRGGPCGCRMSSSPGSALRLVAGELSFPTSLAFAGDGTPLVAESGLPFGGARPGGRVLRLRRDGWEPLADGLGWPVNGLTADGEALFVSEGGPTGRITRIERTGAIETVLDGLPGPGNYHTNMTAIGPDGRLYFSQGALTNTSVVGLDAYEIGWLGRLPHGHDIPGLDIVLTGLNVRTPNPLNGAAGATAETGAFHPFAHPSRPG